LSSQSLVCTGCGCLCDDIQVEIEGDRFTKVENACAKGAALLYSSDNPGRRATCLIGGEKASLEQAIEAAARLLLKARRRLIFDLDNSTLEAQAAAIELASKLGGVIDNASSFSYGTLFQRILSGELPTCSLSQVKDNADLLLYWGSNPPHTHPRHLSKFSYYSYTDYTEAGWFPKVTLSCIEVRDTELSLLCKPAFRLKPGGDKDFITNILVEGKDGTEESKRFVELVREAQFCVIFCGPGLSYSLHGDFDLFDEMVRKLNQRTRIAVIPMAVESNLRGFNQSLYEQTGYVNQVSFAAGVSHGSEFSFLEQVRKRLADCVLIIGSDPFSNLPLSLMRNLQGMSVICLDHFSTPTTNSAEVVIPTALPGLECSGSAIRMDGDEIALVGLKKAGYPTEEEILKQLAERI